MEPILTHVQWAPAHTERSATLQRVGGESKTLARVRGRGGGDPAGAARSLLLGRALPNEGSAAGEERRTSARRNARTSAPKALRWVVS